MPNYVLDSSATQVNTAINNVVNAQNTPTNGSNLMVTSNGIYQALQDIQHTNFNTGTLVTSGDTIASNNTDTQIPTTQAVDAHIDTKLNQVVGFSITNTSNSYQNTAVDSDTFMKSTHFSSSGGFTGNFYGFAETSTGNGSWQVPQAGYYLIHFRATFNDTSSTAHNIHLRAGAFNRESVSFSSSESHKEKHVSYATYLTTNDTIAVTHEKSTGSGGNFQYKNPIFQAIKIA